MEHFERCFLKELPGQYFTLRLINHPALKNTSSAAEAGDVVVKELFSFSTGRGPGWKSHITTGAAGAGRLRRGDGQRTGARGRDRTALRR